jgi:hypothetical protein
MLSDHPVCQVIGSHAAPITKYVVSGRPLKLSYFSSTNPDCSTAGRPTIRLIRAPEHGRVTISKGSDFPNSRLPTSEVNAIAVGFQARRFIMCPSVGSPAWILLKSK